MAHAPQANAAGYHARYLGCYQDQAGARRLPQQALSQGATLDACAEACEGFDFFGLQNRSECWCGASNYLGEALDRSACDLACEAAPSEQCGGAYTNSVYTILQAAPAPTPTAALTPEPTPEAPIPEAPAINPTSAPTPEPAPEAPAIDPTPVPISEPTPGPPAIYPTPAPRPEPTQACRPGEDVAPGTFHHAANPGEVADSDLECNQRCQSTAGCTAWVRSQGDGSCWLTKQSGEISWIVRPNRNSGAPGCVQALEPTPDPTIEPTPEVTPAPDVLLAESFEGVAAPEGDDGLVLCEGGRCALPAWTNPSHPGYVRLVSEVGAEWSTPFGKQAMRVFGYRRCPGEAPCGAETTASVLSEKITAGMDYTLTFNVAPSQNFGDYQVELVAVDDEGNKTTLATITGEPVAKDFSAAGRLVFLAEEGSPLGQRLMIRLLDNDVGSWRETPLFDNILLTRQQGRRPLLNGCLSRAGAVFAAYGIARAELRGEKAGEAVCCDAGGQAHRKLSGQCTSGKNVDNVDFHRTKTFDEARAICERATMRLCHSQEELDTACREGCNFDHALVWVSAADSEAPPSPDGRAGGTDWRVIPLYVFGVGAIISAPLQFLMQGRFVAPWAPFADPA